VRELSFEIVEGPDAGRVVPLAGSLVIGGDEAVEVVLSDPHVERRPSRARRSFGRRAAAPAADALPRPRREPVGLALDPTGRTLFVVDPRAVDGVPNILGNRLHVLVVGENGRLSENDAARARLPVEDGAAPLGIAVVPA
jgi:hypothetical protein